jgi:hypothetical protein
MDCIVSEDKCVDHLLGKIGNECDPCEQVDNQQ